MMMKVDEATKVNQLMETLDHPFKMEIEALREIIKNASPNLQERVKWNAPSYYYRVDLAAFNLRQTKFVQLILLFPNGLVEDPTGIMQGDWKDRREARFSGMEDIQNKKAALENIVNDWVAMIDV